MSTVTKLRPLSSAGTTVRTGPRVHVSIAVTAPDGDGDLPVFPCLESLFRTKGDSRLALRVTVVDNSPGRRVGASIRARFPGVDVIENDTLRGFAANHNAALAGSDAEYYLIANDDLVFLPGALDRAVGYLEEADNARVGVAGFRLLNPDGSLQPSTYSFPTVWRVLLDLAGLRARIPFARWTLMLARLFARNDGRSRFWNHDRTVAVDTFRGALVLVRGAAARAVGPMDEVSLIGGEEGEWHRRFWDQGWSVMFLHDAAVVHLGSQTLECHPSLRGEYLKGTFNFFWKHRSRAAYAAVRVAAAAVLIARTAVAWIGGARPVPALTRDLLRTAFTWRRQ